MGAAIAGRHLYTLVAEVPLPVCIVTYFILAEDVRDEVPCVKGSQENVLCLERKPGCLHVGIQMEGITFTAGWSEVVHQEAKEVVELQTFFRNNFFFQLCLVIKKNLIENIKG